MPVFNRGVGMYIFIGIMLIALTALSEFIMARQQFYRRNIVGIEEFKSYRKMVKVKAEEGMLKGLTVVSFFSGMGFILVGWQLAAERGTKGPPMKSGPFFFSGGVSIGGGSFVFGVADEDRNFAYV